MAYWEEGASEEVTHSALGGHAPHPYTDIEVQVTGSITSLIGCGSFVTRFLLTHCIPQPFNALGNLDARALTSGRCPA